MANAKEKCGTAIPKGCPILKMQPQFQKSWNSKLQNNLPDNHLNNTNQLFSPLFCGALIFFTSFYFSLSFLSFLSFFQGCWRKILVDDFMPFDEDNNLLLPASTCQSELWPMLLAKALIKVANTKWVNICSDRNFISILALPQGAGEIIYNPNVMLL